MAYSTDAAREHRSFVMSSLTASVGFLEASLNELVASASHEDLKNAGAQLPADERRLLVANSEILAGQGGLRLLQRFELTLDLLHRDP
jgi:hypothetical protein